MSMLGESPVVEGRAAAALPLRAGGSPSTDRLVHDPPVRADGLCVVCERERIPERSRKYGGFVAEGDPFCSTLCARAFYGCPLDPATERAIPKARLAA